ncbi:MAG: hypothetical protein JW874_04890 [Spirochaetales bacterium]|nr:hypothetical protein [Spirochaetales bacterium]
MSENSMFSGEIDPEIAELMGIDSKPSSEPEFHDLFAEEKPKQQEKEEVTLTRAAFEPIIKIEENPKPFFTDKDYYKNLLDDGTDAGKRLHSLLSSFMSAQDPKDRSMFRGKLIAAYWNFAERIAQQAHKELPVPKRLVLRFGLVHPGILSQEQRSMISKIIMNNNTSEPVHYVDEWLNKVITGQINPSATDETRAMKVHTNKKVQSQLENIRGQQAFHSGNINSKVSEMETIEAAIKSKLDFISNHVVRQDLGNIKIGYSEQQKQAVMEIQNMSRDLLVLDRDVARAQGELEQISEQVDSLENKADSLGTIQLDTKLLSTEFNTVRQMHKMCVGRQGNHVPILIKNYFRPMLKDTGIREVVINELASIEALDPGLFLRTFKQQTNRIVPHVILVPCYGERGICWEPFERYNKASSRGRIAIPIFTKDIHTAVITACADLRWQVAKEKAQHYWMEEGLTGRYYQWFTSKKIRGDVKEYFIQDYLLWITKESEGTQKLEREARAILWRFTPFPQELRDILRNRGFVYNDLYKRDQNRAMSDGY